MPRKPVQMDAVLALLFVHTPARTLVGVRSCRSASGDCQDTTGASRSAREELARADFELNAYIPRAVDYKDVVRLGLVRPKTEFQKRTVVTKGRLLETVSALVVAVVSGHQSGSLV